MTSVRSARRRSRRASPAEAGVGYARNGKPVAPEGLADPDRVPLYPQVKAEIMAGSIPSGPGKWEDAQTLDECVVGTETATEIRWIR